MPETSPSKIYYPDNNTEGDFVAAMGALADSVQAALNIQGNSFAGTSAERNAFTNDAEEGTWWVDTNGIKGVYQKMGANWTQRFPVDIPEPAVKAAASGRHLFQPTGTNQTLTHAITFPAGRFTKIPEVYITAYTSVPGTVATGASFITTAGCNLHFFRETRVDTTIAWTALQID